MGELLAGGSASRLEAWMRQRLAAELGVEPSRIDPQRPLAEHGVSSRAALGLMGELEVRLGRRLPDTLPWEHPTLRELARWLVGGEEPGFAPAGAAGLRGGSSPEPIRPPAGGSGASPIAIVGLACRFPGADGPEAFWRLLAAGGDAVGPAPPPRRARLAAAVPQLAALPQPGELPSLPGGWLADVAGFDADFFGITAREATAMDPQQRLLLEVAWEALEDAGVTAGELAGRPVGVFVGLSTGDYGQLLLAAPERWEAYAGTGTAPSIAANRISYLLDLRGPSLSVDTACSSSLVAVHLACESLARGESDLAVAAGVNLVLSPALTVVLARGGFLSPGGRCRVFDAAADGYVRGEGCAAVVLAPVAAARQRGDRVRALIRGTAVAQDGRSNGLTAPNRRAQEELLRQACRRAGVEPAELAYVEAHGSGTALGDTLELAALAAVVGRARPAGQPCRVGSVKSNVGHLEAAAGIAGLVKAVLALERREIPPTLHCREPNPRVDFATAGLAVAHRLEPWPAGAAALAGVSSFGFGGTLAHAVLEGAPAAEELPQKEVGEHLLPISARSAAALAELADRYCRRLAGSGLSAAVICRAAARRRDAHAWRLAVVGADASELAAALAAAVAASPARRPATPSEPPRLAFVFAGQGGWPGMGRELCDTEPVCRRAYLEACDLVAAAGGPDLAVRLLGGEADRVDEPALGPPALFALQVALVGLFGAWGIAPDVLLGHGDGEIAAAWASGALTLAEAAEVAVRRAETIRRAVGGLPAAAALHAGRGSRRELALAPRPTAIPLVSTLAGDLAAGCALDAASWERQIGEPGRLAAAANRLAAMEVRLFVELGPDRALSDALLDTLRQVGGGAAAGLAWRALAPHRERRALLAAAGGLWEAGRALDWHGMAPGPAPAVDLPLTAWQHQDFWQDGTTTPALAASPAAASLRLGEPARVGPDRYRWELELDAERLPWARHHRLHGVATLPVSAFLALGRSAAAAALGDGAWAVVDLAVERSLALPDGERRRLQVALQFEGAGRASFQIHSRAAGGGEDGAWVEHSRGRLACASA